MASGRVPNTKSTFFMCFIVILIQILSALGCGLANASQWPVTLQRSISHIQSGVFSQLHRLSDMPFSRLMTKHCAGSTLPNSGE